jgi:hypothetical protein
MNYGPGRKYRNRSLKIDEIRLGNLISFEGKLAVVDSELLNQISMGALWEPVTITEENLRDKLDFNVREIGPCLIADRDPLCLVQARLILNKKIEAPFKVATLKQGNTLSIRYIHQLQNVWFDLTSTVLDHSL